MVFRCSGPVAGLAAVPIVSLEGMLHSKIFSCVLVFEGLQPFEDPPHSEAPRREA